MVWPNRTSALVISLVLLFLYPAVARAGVPVSYITESVQANYDMDGSLQGPVTRQGYVEVEVSNTQDVLQYLVLNLSGTANTNLQSITSYKAVAASPTAGSRTRMYLKTSESDSNLSYEITNHALTPVIYIGIDYSNNAGGQDIYSGGTNRFMFNVTINSTLALGSVTLNIRFARNVLGTADSFNLHGVGSSSGSALAQDSDSDGYYDSIRWVGSLGTSDVSIWFMGDTTPGVNFDEGFMSVDLDQGVSSRAIYQDSTQTLTGMTFSDRFSRGPIREGVTITEIGNWIVRGFIKNIASGTDYVIHGWNLSEIGNPDPLIFSDQESALLPGETKYTDYYDTGISGAQQKTGYYYVSWNWEADWGPSYYSSESLAGITLPVLYEIDSWVSKSVVINSNTESGTTLSVQDQVRHIGHSSLKAGQVTINSVLPRQSSSGEATNTWSPSGVNVLYINGSDQTDITSQVSISTQAAGPSGNGYVNVNIPDLASIIGSGLGQNEYIRLGYSASGSSRATTQTYQFCQTSSLTTLSGTPLSKGTCEDVVIPGVGGEEPGPEPGPGPSPGGGGGAVIQPTLYADIVRDVGEAYFVADNLVKVIASYNIMDTGTRGVKDVRAIIYIPQHGKLDLSSISFRIYDRSEGRWIEWVKDSDYALNDNGLTTIDGKEYREYLLVKKSILGGIFDEGLQLFDGDMIEIGYETTVPVGTSMLVTRASGYNYYQDSYMFEDLNIPVRREGFFQEPEIVDKGWQLEKVYAGSPATWIKALEVSNPNNVSIEYVKSMEVFSDSISAELIQQDGGRESLLLKEDGMTYVDIVFRLGPGEKRVYVIEATTPPVLETGRDVDVIESNQNEIKILVNISLENFALEDYPGVSLLFTSEPERVLYVLEGKSHLNFTEYDSSTTEIYLGDMGSGWKREISIAYTQIPPVVLTAMSAGTYSCQDEATASVFIIPSERESTAYLEVEVVGPSPELSTISAQLVELREMWPWEDVEVPVHLDISSLPDGRYFVYTSFKKDFVTILSDQTDFVVSCPERVIVSVSWVGFLGVAVAIIIYLLIRAWRKRRHGELDDLKKRIRELG